MKKIIITSSFIFAFVVYTLQQYFGLSGTSTYVATNNSSSSVPVTASTTISSQPAELAQPIAQKKIYIDGSFVGSVADAYYGNIQVQATIQNGKITDVQFLQYPNDRNRSVEINTRAMPILKSEAISAQSANVDIVSGATDSSQAFVQSLYSALNQAKNI